MQKNWTREETILAFELYCIIPSKDVTVNNTLVIALGELFCGLGGIEY
ncbi:MAG: hypothetical protein LBM93_10695 [Oscillospiraceae bacterium]|jgi:hypothetical protein|nr:hypothetical protein [Oscillospiraceae bacterium]